MMQYHQSTKIRNETDYDMAKVVAITSYITLLGWLVAIVIYGHHKSALASFHLRQSLGLTVTACLLSFIPLIGWLLNLGVIGAWFLGIYYAIKGQQKLLPILGKFYQQHFDFIK